MNSITTTHTTTTTNVEIDKKPKVVVTGPPKCGKTKLLSKFKEHHVYKYTLRLDDINILANTLFVEYGAAFFGDTHTNPRRQRIMNNVFHNDLKSSDILLFLYTDETLYDVKEFYTSKVMPVLPTGLQIWFVKNEDPFCGGRKVNDTSECEAWAATLTNVSKIRHFEMSTESEESRISFWNQFKETLDGKNNDESGVCVRPIDNTASDTRNTVVVVGPKKSGKSKLLSPFKEHHDYQYTIRLDDINIWEDTLFVEYGAAFFADTHTNPRRQKIMNDEFKNVVQSAKIIICLYNDLTFYDFKELYTSKVMSVLPTGIEIWFVNNKDPFGRCEKEIPESESIAWAMTLPQGSKIRHFVMSTENDKSRLSFWNQSKQIASGNRDDLQLRNTTSIVKAPVQAADISKQQMKVP